MISKKDRTRIIWASFVLITFLILLFVGIVVLGLDFTGAVGTQIIFMSNVAVAISAAVIASSLTGFLDVVVERKFGNSGKVAIRAAGGFAVFAIIMWMSPSNTMKSIEESLFAQASQKCSSAVEGNSGADGLEWCEQLVDRYPDRPEPHRLLARYWHQRAVTEDDFQKARDGFASALAVLNFDPNRIDQAVAIESSNLRPELLENMRRYAASNADLALTVFANSSDADLTSEHLERSLAVADHFLDYYLEFSGEDGAVYYKTLEGRILFYLALIDPESPDLQLLQRSYNAFSYVHPNGRRFFQRDLEAIVVLSVMYTEEENREEIFDVDRRGLRSMGTSWGHLKNTRRSVDSTARFREIVGSMRLNEREEKYRVTLLIGSQRFGGKEFSYIFEKFSDKLSWLDTEFPVRS